VIIRCDTRATEYYLYVVRGYKKVRFCLIIPENPCVGGSSPPRATTSNPYIQSNTRDKGYSIKYNKSQMIL